MVRRSHSPDAAMPLLDHFHPPIDNERPWSGFHSNWASVIAQTLNGDVLPERYFAMPEVRLGGRIEVDVATMNAGESFPASQLDNASTATAVWAPSMPTISAEVAFSRPDQFEVQIYRDEGGRTLVAAIELVSPANKDRPAHRRAFVTKCEAYLQSGVAVVLVDVVTTRTSNLHVELMTHLDVDDSSPQNSGHLYAVAYRTFAHDDRVKLDAWKHNLAVGRELPSLPLWLESDLAVPIDLEETYTETCRSLRMTPIK